MKKGIAVALLLVMLLSACSAKRERVITWFDRTVERLGSLPVTSDRRLIGERRYDDTYTGQYYSDQDRPVTGRDTIFGGTSVRGRQLRLTADITTRSGSATLQLQLGTEKKEFTTNGDGRFETELELSGGGNYIMLDYDEFVGTVMLVCSYDFE